MNWIVLFLFSTISLAAGETPYGFVLDGVLYDSPGGSTTLLDTGTIRVQILNPAKTCVLYDEQQSFNTTASNGAFSLSIGTAVGSGRRVAGSDQGNSMTTVFQNRTASITGAACTYSPSAGDGRYVRVFVTPTGTGVTDQLFPEMLVGSVPTALVAESLQGIDKTGFLQLGAQALTQANLETVFTTANYSTLSSLLSGGGSTGGTNTGAYTINSGTGGSGGINFNTNGTTRASIAYNGDFTVGSNALFVNGTSGKVGLGTSSTTYDFSLGGAINRAIGMERHSTANTAGNSLTVSSGGATSGATDKAGGDLYLASGAATGTGSSSIFLQTATAGAAGTTDRSPTTKMTILGSGNVGIGITTPLKNLDIMGATGQPGSLGIRSLSGEGAKIYFGTNNQYDGTGSNSAGALTFNDSIGGGFEFRTNNGSGNPDSSSKNKMVITAAGNVGIGTTTPDQALTVTRASGGAWVKANATNASSAGFEAISNSGLRAYNVFYAGGAAADQKFKYLMNENGSFILGKANDAWDTESHQLVVLNNGRVGIGTASPNTAMHLYGSGDVVSTVQTSSGTGSSAALRLLGAASNADWHILTNRADLNGDADSLGFYKTSGTSGTKMVIQDDGNVGIGTTDPQRRLHVRADGGYQVRLQNGSAGGGFWHIGQADTTFGSGGGKLLFVPDADASTSAAVTFTNSGRVGIGTTDPQNTLHVNGTLRVTSLNGATATQVCIDGSNVLSSCSSSIRYKENVKDLSPSLEGILGLRPVSYDWIQSKEHDVGFIAEEVEKVDSRLVTYNKEGRIQGVKYDQLASPIVKAIQELYQSLTGTQREITSLTAENRKLKQENAEMKVRLDRIEKKLGLK